MARKKKVESEESAKVEAKVKPEVDNGEVLSKFNILAATRVKLKTSCVSFNDGVVFTDADGYAVVSPKMLERLKSLGVVADE